MNVISGNGKNQIAGAKVGELVWVHLTNQKVEKVMLSEIKRNGIEGFEVDLKDRPLTFYPFDNILKIKKYTEIQG